MCGSIFALMLTLLPLTFKHYLYISLNIVCMYEVILCGIINNLEECCSVKSYRNMRNIFGYSEKLKI